MWVRFPPPNNIRVPADVSPDGTELALFAITERQEHLFIADIDGSHMRRLTDDPWRDRAPMFTRDGKSVIFYSNRDGNWAGWTLRLDGSGLKKLWSLPEGITYPMPSPVNDDVVFSGAKNSLQVYKASLKGTVRRHFFRTPSSETRGSCPQPGRRTAPGWPGRSSRLPAASSG